MGFFDFLLKTIFYQLLALFMVVFFFLSAIFFPPLLIVYYFWSSIIGTKRGKRGERRCDSLRSLKIWQYIANYFPVKLTKQSDFQLDPERNYLFCAFPHGIISAGVSVSFLTTAVGFDQLFPSHKPHVLTLKLILQIPLFSDLLLALGASSASEDSINMLMGARGGGNVAVLVVGGSAEALYSKPGEYRLVLKNRKGFAKVALKNGSPLVPVFSFGETEILDQLTLSEDSIITKFQMWFKKVTSLPAILPIGRNYFKLPLILKRTPINVVVGEPIDVKKTENPTEEEIDALHKTFIERLTELFENNKQQYLKNASNKNLIIL